MKKIILSAIIALLPLTGYSATILGFQAGGGSWKHKPSGDITASEGGVGTTADLQNDLQLSEKSEGYSYFILEHPVPLVPNIKYITTKLSSSGSGNVTATFDFNGQTYATNASVTTFLDLDQTDTILYYEILDNGFISLDLGLAAKSIDGKASVDDGTNSDVTSFSGTIPMLYAAVEIGLPAGFALSADISTISAAGNTISDVTTKVTYTSDYFFGVEAGLRSQTYDIDVDSVKAKMKFSGIFAGVFFKF
ncbi:MAG: TIGR04219 family outer membrane beta-barrel protein [Woeseiaceae bacterium]